MDLFTTTFKALGGPGEIRLAAPGEATARRWFKAALDEIDRIEITYSRYRPDSLISRINAAAGHHGVTCDAEMLGLLDVAHALHDQSGGRFDISSGIWRRAWNFRDPEADIPTQAQLNELAPLVGWHRVERDGMQVRLPRAGMELDFGGIGKEYAVDRAAVVLMEHGALHALVNLAGDLRAVGPKPDGSPWQVGIQHPEKPDAVMAEIPLAEGALATSGDYQRCLWRHGRRYSHLLNAATGWPVEHWRSISVRAPSALLAGGLSTCAMLMEAEGLDLLKRSGVDFLAVDAHGEVHTRAGTMPSGA
jgi:thiamine biosynthesis lipoprotein